MQQYQAVDMSQYRQQQQLLHTQTPVVRMPPTENSLPQEQGPRDDQNSNINNNNAEVGNLHEQEIYQGQHNNNHPNINFVHENLQQPANRNNKYRIVKMVLDLCMFGYILGRYLDSYGLPLFANVYIMQYIYHYCKNRFQKQIDRAFITFMALWPIFKLVYYGFNTLYQEQKVYILLYSIELIPNLCGLAVTCCIVSCTCFCTTCCFCCCALDQVRKSIANCIQRFKYKKVKDQLCTHNLHVIEGAQCTICLLEGNQMVTLRCAHSFHPGCLRNWIQQHRTCPNCRTNLY